MIIDKVIENGTVDKFGKLIYCEFNFSTTSFLGRQDARFTDVSKLYLTDNERKDSDLPHMQSCIIQYINKHVSS